MHRQCTISDSNRRHETERGRTWYNICAQLHGSPACSIPWAAIPRPSRMVSHVELRLCQLRGPVISEPQQTVCSLSTLAFHSAPSSSSTSHCPLFQPCLFSPRAALGSPSETLKIQAFTKCLSHRAGSRHRQTKRANANSSQEVSALPQGVISPISRS
jgi:hypothetical protein